MNEAAQHVASAREHEACGFWGLSQNKRRASREYRERLAAMVRERQANAAQAWLKAVLAVLA
jgi:hypothetical protein